MHRDRSLHWQRAQLPGGAGQESWSEPLEGLQSPAARPRPPTPAWEREAGGGLCVAGRAVREGPTGRYGASGPAKRYWIPGTRHCAGVEPRDEVMKDSTVTWAGVPADDVIV